MCIMGETKSIKKLNVLPNFQLQKMYLVTDT